MQWFTNLSLDALVEQLQRANFAYHNGSGVIMGDDAYDRGLEELRRRSPSHPFLSVIGAKVPKGAVVLPVTMGSQDKVRHGEGGLERWMARKGGAAGVKVFVTTEKLDGLSALYVSHGSVRRLYLRGDGVKGVDVSRVLSRIPLPSVDCIVRGELILRSEKTPAGSIGRSLVNGWVHRSLDTATEVPSELADVEFLAYHVIEPIGLVRSQQLAWLQKNGFKTPWNIIWPRAAITDEQLKKTLVTRRAESAYPLDGLVVATDTVPIGVGGGEAKNPPDSVAFKAALDEQKASTRVVGIEWNQSRQGSLIPRIQIEPVVISGATIQWISGHNAAFIESNKLGAGAEIVVRRSGDVIPTVDSVVRGTGGGWDCPTPGTWNWDERHVHAVSTGDDNTEKALLHALQTLEVEGIGPGLVKKMVEGGIVTMKDLWQVSEGDLAAAIGAGRAPTLKKSLLERRTAASDVVLLVASNKLPRGVGERKLRPLCDKEMNPRKWTPALFSSDVPAGWTAASLAGLWGPLKEALAWIDESFPGVAALPSAPSAAPAPAASNFVVFTNVRDHDLEKLLPSKGWQVIDSVTKKTTVLVVPDGADVKESGKVKKAQASGVRIMPISEFRKMISN